MTSLPLATQSIATLTALCTLITAAAQLTANGRLRRRESYWREVADAVTDPHDRSIAQSMHRRTVAELLARESISWQVRAPSLILLAFPIIMYATFGLISARVTLVSAGHAAALIAIATPATALGFVAVRLQLHLTSEVGRFVEAFMARQPLHPQAFPRRFFTRQWTTALMGSLALMVLVSFTASYLASGFAREALIQLIVGVLILAATALAMAQELAPRPVTLPGPDDSHITQSGGDRGWL